MKYFCCFSQQNGPNKIYQTFPLCLHHYIHRWYQQVLVAHTLLDSQSRLFFHLKKPLCAQQHSGGGKNVDITKFRDLRNQFIKDKFHKFLSYLLVLFSFFNFPFFPLPSFFLKVLHFPFNFLISLFPPFLVSFEWILVTLFPPVPFPFFSFHYPTFSVAHSKFHSFYRLPIFPANIYDLGRSNSS